MSYPTLRDFLASPGLKVGFWVNEFMTPAIGIEPMKPMTTMRFRFRKRKWKQ